MGNRAGVSNLLNYPPDLEKWQKMVNFVESSPPMLNIDLHPCEQHSSEEMSQRCQAVGDTVPV